MNLKYTVEPTEIRYTSPPYHVPTVTIAVTVPSGDDAAAYHKATLPQLMSAAHSIAARMWTMSIVPTLRDQDLGEIQIEVQHGGVARVTIDVGRDADTMGSVLAALRDIVAGVAA